MEKIYLDPRLENRGFYGYYRYENEFAKVSLGSTNEASLERILQIRITFFDACEIICGPNEYDYFMDIFNLKNDQKIIDFLFDVFKKIITPQTMFSILNYAKKQGEINGEIKLQNALKKIIGIS